MCDICDHGLRSLTRDWSDFRVFHTFPIKSLSCYTNSHPQYSSIQERFRSPSRHSAKKILYNISLVESTSHTFDLSPNMATSSQQATMETYYQDINHHLAHDWLFALLATVSIVLAYRIMQSSRRRSRMIASLNIEAHHYFSIPTQWYAFIKNHILYAPLLSWNLGKLPTRFQALFLTAVIGANAILCFYNVPYGDPELDILGILRSRTGTIAVANLIPIIIMSSVKNPLINILDISYNSFNFMHRWFGRIAIVEGALHATCHVTSVVQRGGWASFVDSIPNPTIWTGLGAVSAFILIFVQSFSVVRSTFYETFLHIHIGLAAAALVLIWMHLAAFPQRSLIVASAFL